MADDYCCYRTQRGEWQAGHMGHRLSRDLGQYDTQEQALAVIDLDKLRSMVLPPAEHHKLPVDGPVRQ